MPQATRRRLAPRRRRTDDDFEDETSTVGDIDDDSSTDASGLSNDVDGDGSDEEENNEGDAVPHTANAVKPTINPSATSPIPEGTRSAPLFPTSNDTAAMMTTLTISEEQKNQPELQYEDSSTGNGHDQVASSSQTSVPPSGPAKQNPAQRARMEHQEYLKQRDSNPAFVPNRGGFFLHDDRASGTAPWSRPFGRGRGRGNHGLASNGRNGHFAEALDQQWAHDLHDHHETKPVVQTSADGQNLHRITQAGGVSQSAGPKREFSFTAVLGAVKVNIVLPGIEEQRTPTELTKKKHILLPTHRPPLRRDKPVRISIPDVEPSYRFPSTDRSFIFIPRAMRPNQQFSMRGRGRGSFHGSRRPSIMGGSVYTPSVAMSRKSSFGGVRDGRSPAGSVYGRPNFPAMEPPRPVVRLPGGGSTFTPQPPMPYGYPNEGPLQPAFMNAKTAEDSFNQQHRNTCVGKSQSASATESAAVSSAGANICGPTSFRGVGEISGTPLSHIPEGAVYAQPFQPYPIMAAPVYYPPQYGNGAIYYPSMPDPMQNFGQNWTDPSQQRFPAPQFSGPSAGPPGNEQNGPVFYADPSMPGMMPMPTGGYGFYPMVNNFYQTQA
ncbi:uncharacterized protein AB675_1466 [Cyphellophora attinorum]|uniref:Btz domain-containing protein n=1 Tax=Cyphellophora attinorum TaxID=1664694 RepID=A0A0N1NYU6_9EURO|nr:uncharacterized protein AB675_1466 [Phialophora attinorum]KPI37302.1 hypothetical protein AB675_1466 [Phialophora attinorum]